MASGKWLPQLVKEESLKIKNKGIWGKGIFMDIIEQTCSVKIFVSYDNARQSALTRAEALELSKLNNSVGLCHQPLSRAIALLVS